jgi:hypothetical protein
MPDNDELTPDEQAVYLTLTPRERGVYEVLPPSARKRMLSPRSRLSMRDAEIEGMAETKFRTEHPHFQHEIRVKLRRDRQCVEVYRLYLQSADPDDPSEDDPPADVDQLPPMATYRIKQNGTVQLVNVEE